jgi:hypothetical protein
MRENRTRTTTSPMEKSRNQLDLHKWLDNELERKK